ncbi:hypothetical protein AB0940_18625 [Streptomyces sp. NPDC006656]|uniref:hypothetical protein n=1 Tax=Streptomyces sp. NPDC006656 TaxID=3156899 RepID=UPI003456DA7F
MRVPGREFGRRNCRLPVGDSGSGSLHGTYGALLSRLGGGRAERAVVRVGDARCLLAAGLALDDVRVSPAVPGR